MESLSDPRQSAASFAANIVENVLGSSSVPKEQGITQADGEPEQPAKSKISVPQPKYHKLTASKHQEIGDIVTKFHSSLSEFAAVNGLNPVDVTRHALGGELKVAKLNSWKCFQVLNGMARNGCKFTC